MKVMGIKAQYIKPYTVTTIDSDFSSKLKNILEEDFNPPAPDSAWCSDITYIWTLKGFVYLTVSDESLTLNNYHGFIFTKNYILGT